MEPKQRRRWGCPTTLVEHLRGLPWTVHRKLKVVGSVIRKHPSTLIAPLAMLSVLLALGIWGVIWGAAREAQQQKDQALSFAKTFMADYQRRVTAARYPLLQLDVIIRSQPEAWGPLNASVPALIPDIVKKTEQNNLLNIFIAPQGRLGAIYIAPLLKVGMDFMAADFPGAPMHVAMIERRGPQLNGPFLAPSLETFRGQIFSNASEVANQDASTTTLSTYVTYLLPVFVAVPPGWASQQLPWDVPPVTDCAAPCHTVENGEVFWGILGATMRIDDIISQAAFVTAGYRFAIYAPSRNAFDANAAPWDTPVLLVNSTDPVRDPVKMSASMDATNAKWTMYLSPHSGSWRPAWEAPLLAVVIVVSIALASLQFMALLAWRQHHILLVSLLPGKVLEDLRSAHDYGTSAVVDETSGTVADTLMHVIGVALQGEPPDLRDLVLLRTAVLRRADIYRPLDLGARFKAANMDSDVASALARELDASASAEVMAAGWSRTAGCTPRSRMHGSTPSSMLQPPDAASNEALFHDLSTGLACIVLEGLDGGAGGSLNDKGMGGAPHDQGNPAFSCQATITATSLIDASFVPANVHLTTPEADGTILATHSDTYTLSRVTDTSQRSAAVLVQPLPVASCPDTREDTSADTIWDRAVVSLTGPRRALSDDLKHALDSANEWAFDATALATHAKGHPLAALGFYVLTSTGLMKQFQLQGATVARYLMRVESMYIDNPYHNAMHAADVLQTMHVQLQRGGLAGTYANPLAQLACYMAAIVHDLGHPGRTNDFLCATSHSLAVRYNDKAPLENHHVSEAFALLHEPGLNFLTPLTKEQRLTLRRMVIELVLGTDMKQHFSLLSQFKTLHSCAAAGTSDACRSSPAAAGNLQVDNSCASNMDDAGKLLTLQVALKCSDLGHLAAPLQVHLKWVANLEEEFFRQGDEEAAAQLPVSPLFARNKPGVTKSQVSFLDFCGLPLFHALAVALPAMRPLREGIDANYRYWQMECPTPARKG